MHPGVRRIGTDELEAQRPQPATPGPLDGVELRAGHPQGRVRLLDRLRHHVAQGNIEVLTVVLAAALLEHWEDGRHCLLEHGTLVVHGATKGFEFGDGRALAHAEFAATVAQEVEHSY